MIHVIATIELNDSQRAAFLNEFHKIVPQVLAEDGCIAYGPTIDVPTDIPAQQSVRENVVTILEAWESVEHLKRHLDAPHMHDYRTRVKSMVARTTLAILTPA